MATNASFATGSGRTISYTIDYHNGELAIGWSDKNAMCRIYYDPPDTVGQANFQQSLADVAAAARAAHGSGCYRSLDSAVWVDTKSTTSAGDSAPARRRQGATKCPGRVKNTSHAGLAIHST